MPSLSPDELQEARRASGRLGGRPRRPTRDEAREHALADLVPKALKVLAAHLGDGEEINPDAWRAALRVFEYAFGRPPDDGFQDSQTASVADMDPAERARLLQEALRVVRGAPDDAAPAPE